MEIFLYPVLIVLIIIIILLLIFYRRIKKFHECIKKNYYYTFLGEWETRHGKCFAGVEIRKTESGFEEPTYKIFELNPSWTQRFKVGKWYQVIIEESDNEEPTVIFRQSYPKYPNNIWKVGLYAPDKKKYFTEM